MRHSYAAIGTVLFALAGCYPRSSVTVHVPAKPVAETQPVTLYYHVKRSSNDPWIVLIRTSDRRYSAIPLYQRLAVGSLTYSDRITKKDMAELQNRVTKLARAHGGNGVIIRGASRYVSKVILVKRDHYDKGSKHYYFKETVAFDIIRHGQLLPHGARENLFSYQPSKCWLTAVKPSFEGGRRHGVWRYRWGRKTVGEATYRNGVKHGLQKCYSAMDRQDATVLYDNGRVVARNGLERVVWRGRLVREATFRSDKFHGVVKNYHRGRLFRVRRFVDGRQVGLETMHGHDGRILSKSSWRNGTLHGPAVRYHGPGVIAEQRHFVDGKLHGVLSRYDRNGRLRSTIAYRNGRRHGPSQHYDSSGKVTSVSVYRNGKYVGRGRVTVAPGGRH